MGHPPLVRSEGARAYGLAKKCRRLKPAVNRGERLTPTAYAVG
jgi:hypothetical protein